MRKKKELPINAVIRNSRKEHQLTQEQLAEGIVCRTTLTAFEKGGQNILYRTLRQYLKRLHITPDEFERLLSGGVLDQQQQLSQALRNNYEEGNYEAVLRGANNSYKLYVRTKDFYYFHLYAQYRLILDRKKFAPVPENDQKEIRNKVKAYLESVENWGRFEMSIFTNLMFLFDFDEIDFVYRKVKKYKETFTSADKEFQLYAKTVMNILDLARERHALSRYRLLVVELLEELGPKDLFEENYCDFYLALLKVETDNDPEAIQAVNDCIRFLLMKKKQRFADEMAAEANQYLGRPLFDS